MDLPTTARNVYIPSTLIFSPAIELKVVVGSWSRLVRKKAAENGL